ncbi:MAG TPA: hypothetical protein VH601_13995 [Bryobacteraceae bacterium]
MHGFGWSVAAWFGRTSFSTGSDSLVRFPRDPKPATTIVPRVDGNRVVSVLMSVVLPDPFGSNVPKIDTGWVTDVRQCNCAKPARKILRLDGRMAPRRAWIVKAHSRKVRHDGRCYFF